MPSFWSVRQSHGVFPALVTNEAQSLFCLPLAVLLVLLFRWDDVLTRLRPIRLLSWVGLFSYSLYLSHYIALRVVDQGAARLPFVGAYPLLLYLVKAAACIGGGWLFFRFFERPFLNTRQRQEEREVMGAAP